MENIEITYKDGSTNTAAVFRHTNAKVTLICLPALGVRASYYQDFCARLNDSGFNVVLIDWRGNGKSSLRASRANSWGYEQLLEDLSELRNNIDDWFPHTNVIAVGHSLGGQIAALYASRYQGRLVGIGLVASCLVHYTGWSGFGQFKIWSVGHVFVWISKLIGYFPGNKLGFGGREAKDLMRDWGWNARSGKYELVNSDFNYEAALAKLRVPILAITVESDTLAPKAATTNLYRKFHTDSEVEHINISPKEAGVDILTHFNWVKNASVFVKHISKWANEVNG